MATCLNKCKDMSLFNNLTEKEIQENEKLLIEIPCPPNKIHYETSLKDNYNSNDNKNLYINQNQNSEMKIKKLKFSIKNFPEEIYPWIKNECYSLSNKNNQDLNLIILRIKNNFVKDEKNNFTIFYSHENFVDLGIIYPFLVDLSTQLKVKI
jgi:hypothetical protein